MGVSFWLFFFGLVRQLDCLSNKPNEDYVICRFLAEVVRKLKFPNNSILPFAYIFHKPFCQKY